MSDRLPSEPRRGAGKPAVKLSLKQARELLLFALGECREGGVLSVDECEQKEKAVREAEDVLELRVLASDLPVRIPGLSRDKPGASDAEAAERDDASEPRSAYRYAPPAPRRPERPEAPEAPSSRRGRMPSFSGGNDKQVSFSMFGDRRVRPSFKDGSDFQSRTLLGRQVVDLSDAVNADGPVDLYVQTMLGETVILVPPGMDVVPDLALAFAGLTNKTRQGADVESSGVVVRLHGFAFMAGIEIRNA